MQDKNNKYNFHEHDELPESLKITSSVASATEMTGFMPTPPQNSAEQSTYSDLADMAIPKHAPAKNPNAKKRHAEKSTLSKYFDNRP